MNTLALATFIVVIIAAILTVFATVANLALYARLKANSTYANDPVTLRQINGMLAFNSIILVLALIVVIMMAIVVAQGTKEEQNYMETATPQQKTATPQKAHSITLKATDGTTYKLSNCDKNNNCNVKILDNKR